MQLGINLNRWIGTTDRIVLCGGLNCPGVDGSHTNKELEIVLDTFKLTQHINSPTCGDSLLDIIACEDVTSMWNIRLDEAGLPPTHCSLLQPGSSHPMPPPHIEKYRLPCVRRHISSIGVVHSTSQYTGVVRRANLHRRFDRN